MTEDDKLYQWKDRQREAKDTYTTMTVCLNCGRRASVEITRGTTFDQYRRQNECVRCGCTTLMQARELGP